MKTREYVVGCPEKNFICTEFIFNYRSDTHDATLLKHLIKRGIKLAAVVNPTLARNASRRRTFQTVRRNCIAGVIAEYSWRYWLNSEAIKQGLKVSAKCKVFQSVDKHIDISVMYPGGTSKTVEVRSSFPYTGLQNAICRVFDIVGWYVNPVKTKEIKKDYYARVLYPFNSKELRSKLMSDSFSVFLAGGATRSLLEQSPYSKDKNFIPYDDVDSMLSTELGTYRVIEPIVNAYDTPKITWYILNQKM
jgi:hypothetical protein